MRKLLLPLLLVSLVFTVACDDSAYHKAAKAAATISSSLKSAQDLNASLYADNLLDKQETVAVARAISDATLANDAYISRVRTLGKLDPNNKALIATWTRELAKAVEQYGAQFAHVKNPQAKAKLVLTAQAIQAAVQIIETAVR